MFVLDEPRLYFKQETEILLICVASLHAPCLADICLYLCIVTGALGSFSLLLLMRISSIGFDLVINWLHCRHSSQTLTNSPLNVTSFLFITLILVLRFCSEKPKRPNSCSLLYFTLHFCYLVTIPARRWLVSTKHILSSWDCLWWSIWKCSC